MELEIMMKDLLNNKSMHLFVTYTFNEKYLKTTI